MVALSRWCGLRKLRSNGYDTSRIGSIFNSAWRPLALDMVDAGATAVAVVGHGPAIARRLLPDCALVGLRSFDQLGAKTGFHAPSTQHDLWIWFQGTAPDALFDRALAAHLTFGAYAELPSKICRLLAARARSEAI